MYVVWLLDRAIALLAYPALALAVFTGIFYNESRFGPLYRAAQHVHIEVSVFALVLMLGHAVIGVFDTYLVASGQVPQPAYSLRYLLAGVAVGAGALFLLLVAVLGFLDPSRFGRPWGPRVVHGFAYAGFVFATAHAAAVGTDVVGLLAPIGYAGLAFLVYVLVLRLLVTLGVDYVSDEEPVGSQ